ASHWSSRRNTSFHCKVVILGDSGSSGGDMVKIDGQFNYATGDCVRSFVLLFVAVRRPNRTNCVL
ncbi:MAG: hypothetical protein ACK53Y_28220, partial [bacterium]